MKEENLIGDNDESQVDNDGSKVDNDGSKVDNDESQVDSDGSKVDNDDSKVDDNENEVVTVQNELSYFDLLAARSSPLAPWLRLFLVALVGALIGVGVSYFYPDLFGPIVMAPLVAMYSVFIDLMAVWTIFKRNAKNTTATFEFRKDAIYVTTLEGLKSKVGWQTVIRIEQKPSAIALQITKKPDTYYWFPLRRFRTRAQADHFLTLVNEYWSHWLMTASLESTKAVAETSADPGVDVEIGVKELILCDMYLLRNMVIRGLFLLVLGAVQAIFSWIGFIVIVCAVFVMASPAIEAWRKAKRTPNLLSGRTTITEEGVHPYNSFAGYDTVIGWTSIRKIYTRNGILFFELMNSRAVVVPLRCFASKEAADEFVSLAKAKWSQHQSKSLESLTK